MEDLRNQIKHHVHGGTETLEVCLNELLRVLLHEIDQGYTGLEDELIEDPTVVVVEVSDDKEELPHPWGHLVLVVQKLTQAGDAILNTRAADLGEGGLDRSL